MALLSPAYLYNFLLGQNGAFTAALLLSSLSLRTAGVAGMLGGILANKPQLAITLPFAWLGAGRRGAIGAAAVTAAGLAAASVLLFGLAPWRLWIADTLPTMRYIMEAPFPQGFQANSITLFVLARAMGLGAGASHAVAAVAALAALGMAFWLWRQETFNRTTRLALTLALGLLAMPYGYVYDMTGYQAILAILVIRQGISWPWALFWIWPAYARDVTDYLHAPITPLVLLASVVWLIRGVRPARLTSY
jgi:hypothetical protein